VTQLLGGRYSIERRIGEGGMAEVFLARDHAQAEAPVVVKRCRAHLAYEPETAQLFLREARLASLIRHPNVVRVDATGEQDGQPYLVMEYLQGLTVRDIYLRAVVDGGIPQDVAAAIVLGAARGLAAAHSALDEQGRPMGLVHRDVSPHNLFVTDAGLVKVLDFGIAKGAFDVTTTRAGHVKGKASYLAPEQLDLSPEARPIDARVDLFALGIVAWELFTGRRLFKRGTEADTIAAIRNLRVGDPLALRPELDGGYAATVMRLLAREPDERPSQAQEVVDALEATLARRAPDLGEGVLAQYVTKLRDRAPAEPRAREPSVAKAPDAPAVRKPPPLPTPTASPRPAAGDESTATVAPPQLLWKGLGGQAPPVDGSVVGTWAVAGAGQTPDVSGGFEPLTDLAPAVDDEESLAPTRPKGALSRVDPGAPPERFDPEEIVGLPLPFGTPPPPHFEPRGRDAALATAAGDAQSPLLKLLYARPPMWVIVSVLAGSLLAGLVLSFVIASIFG
jgi:serine/threonine-protein kinase